MVQRVAGPDGRDTSLALEPAPSLVPIEAAARPEDAQDSLIEDEPTEATDDTQERQAHAG